MSFKVSFNADICKGCELCMGWCRKELLGPDVTCLNKSGIHPMGIQRQEECIGCGNCALMCPDGVITIEKLD